MVHHKGFATAMSARRRWHNARGKSHDENGCERPEAMLALLRNYVLEGTRRCDPLLPMLTAPRPLPHCPAPACRPGAALAAQGAMRFILLELKGAGSVDAKSVIDAAERAGISVAL